MEGYPNPAILFANRELKRLKGKESDSIAKTSNWSNSSGKDSRLPGGGQTVRGTKGDGENTSSELACGSDMPRYLSLPQKLC
jgi:hypothetical protein